MANDGPRYLSKLEVKLRKELDITLDQIESLWHQKPRVDVIRDGNRNTTYYHTSTIIRRRFNCIETLKGPDGTWHSDPIQVQNLVEIPVGQHNHRTEARLVSWETVNREKDNGGLEVRSMRQLNSAYLMKLGWRLATESKTLWVKVLKMEYCKGNDVENMRVMRQASSTWRGIMDNIHLTKEQKGHVIADGRRTKFWIYKWIDGKELLFQVVSDIPEEKQH
ncbi:hypothetical protein Cgig2_021825 [Carnegiea gigantea]|uniref:Uncharacterized protein n=1 Tax=Carnegiea gigantea TaxID=171969 RepID=A0A9Q1QKF7_9CARY|nr:hypothetical protein Cgig2_021825 [Carnegiea gigantea]